MGWLEAVVLGIVQGLTEFLPVSSSAHLRITSAFFFGNDAGAAFTAVTQLGTETAVLIYFFSDIWRLLRAWFVGLARKDERGYDYKLAWYVILGSIPIGVLGLAFEDVIKGPARNLYLNATVLIVFALVLAAAERYSRQRRGPDQDTSPADGRREARHVQHLAIAGTAHHHRAFAVYRSGAGVSWISGSVIYSSGAPNQCRRQLKMRSSP